jgi:hypothetical protein
MKTTIRILFIILNLLLFNPQSLKAVDSFQDKNSYKTQYHCPVQCYHLENYKQDKESFIEKSIPWFIALLIGILSTITNIVISKRLNKTSSENIDKQLTNSKEITLKQFKATLHSQNMQHWSDEVRENLSDFLSISAYIRAKMSDSRKKSEDEIFDSVIEDFKILNKHKVKLLTLLSLKNPEEKVIAEKIVKLMQKEFATKEEFSASEHIQLENSLLADARTLFEKQ